MREILFRGKELNTDSYHFVDWCYGSLVYSPSEDQCYIVEHYDEECSFPVDKETIGQYTGFEDKNGTKIFEGDKVRILSNSICCAAKIGEVGTVYFDKGSFHLYFFELYDDVVESDFLSNFINGNCVVIGNIYDNPDLLEVAE